MTFRDSIASTDEGIAKIFASHFEKVYVEDSAVISDGIVTISKGLSAISLTLLEVFEGLQSINANTGPRPDGMTSLLPHNRAFTIALPIFTLFNKSLTSRFVPDL